MKIVNMSLKRFFISTLVALCTSAQLFAIEKITSENYSSYGFNSTNFINYLGYYAISKADDLEAFATLVNNGETSINGVLTADIDFSKKSKMIGTSTNYYKGVFDGQNHKVKVNYSVTADYVALFARLSGTVKNLTTEGTIKTSKKFAAGIAASTKGANILNCISSVEINSTKSGDGTHGGIIGINDANTTTIKNCAFIGKMGGSSTTNCGGICGYATTKVNIINCYLNAAISCGTSGSYTFSRNSGQVSITDSYYVNSFGTVQGTQISEEQFEEKLKDLQKIYFVPLVTSDNYSFLGLTKDYIGFSPISNASDLAAFANKVNNDDNTINGILLADIDFSSNTEMIGTSKHPYQGIFDGQKHTITIGYKNITAKYSTLFSYCSGTVKNLTVDGSLHSKSGMNVGGIAGYLENGTISNCISAVDLKSDKTGDASVAGLVGEASNSVVKNCGFVGSITTKTNGTGNCGIICWCTTNTTNVISNCFVAATLNTTGFNTFTRNPNYAMISNCYYTTNLGTVQGTQITAEQVTNGNLCHLLNGGNPDGVWRQTIGTDDYPKFIGEKVYDKSNFNYTNDQSQAIENPEISFKTEDTKYYTSSSIKSSLYYSEMESENPDITLTAEDGTIRFYEKANNQISKYAYIPFSISVKVPANTEYTYEANVSVSTSRHNTSSSTISHAAELLYFGSSDKKDEICLLYSTTPSNSEYSKFKVYTEAKLVCLNTRGSFPISFKNTSDEDAVITQYFGYYTAIGWGTAYKHRFESICSIALGSRETCPAYVATGKYAGFYEIKTADELQWFARQVNMGNNEINAVLKADIDFSDYSEMIGTSANHFKGIFDGENHNVTINYNTTENSTAIFRHLQGTVKNLTTSGYINTTNQFAAGIASDVYETAYIENCLSSVAINSNGQSVSSSTFAGIASVNRGTLYIKNCGFVGSIGGTSTTSSAGIIGGHINASHTYIENSFVALTYTCSLSSTCTFTREPKITTLTNCYYLNAFGNAQGTQVTAEQVANGELCWLLNEEKTLGAWRQTLGSDNYPNFTGGVVEYDKTNDVFHCYIDGTCVLHDNEYQSATLVTEENYKLLSLSTDFIGYYAIANAGQMAWFANQVSAGNVNINAVLVADIDFMNNTEMVGNSSNYLSGIFDGQFHKITIGYNVTYADCALFFGLKGTIKNLYVDGSITSTNKYVASVCIYMDGSSKMTSVISSVDITSSYDSGTGYGDCAGLIRNCKSVYVQIENCAFVGSINTKKLYGVAGIVGWATENITLKNCYVSASMSAKNGSVQPNAIFARNSSKVNVINCYYGNYNSGLGSHCYLQGKKITNEQFISGELCYLLNNGNTNDDAVWRQTLGTDAYPVFNGGIVGKTVTNTDTLYRNISTGDCSEDIQSVILTDNNTFTIERIGTNGDVEFFYRTLNGSAIGGVHFDEVWNSITIAEGESKSAPISLPTEKVVAGTDSYYLDNTEDKPTRVYYIEAWSKNSDPVIIEVNLSSSEYVTDDIYSTDEIEIASNKTITQDDGAEVKYLEVDITNKIDPYINGTDYFYQFRTSFNVSEETDGYEFIDLYADSTNRDNSTREDPRISDESANYRKAAVPVKSLYTAAFQQSDVKVSTKKPYGFPIPNLSNEFNNDTIYAWNKSNYYNWGNTSGILHSQYFNASIQNLYDASGYLNIPNSTEILGIATHSAGVGDDIWILSDAKFFVKVVDTTAPRPQNLQINTKKSYVSGENVYMAVQYDEIVLAKNVTTATTSAGDFEYVGGSGTNVLYFKSAVKVPTEATVIEGIDLYEIDGTITDMVGNVAGNNTLRNDSFRMYAQYTLRYETNGGTINGQYPQSYTYGEVTALPMITRTGYTFAGWYDNPEFKNNSVAALTETDRGGKIFYAKWNVNVYKIDYVVDGGSFNNAAAVDTCYTYGVKTILTEDISRVGYNFEGWFESTGFSGSKIRQISATTIGDKVFFAKWTPITSTITFNNQSATKPGTISKTAVYDSLLTNIEVPERTGYTFVGYYSATDGKGTKYFNAEGVCEKAWDKVVATTLYAQWTANTYGVILDGQSATQSGQTYVDVTFGSQLSNVAIPLRTGYTFVGYYTKPNGEGDCYYNSLGIGTKTWNIAGNTTLYAKWTINSYGITYNYNGGTIKEGEVKSYTYGVEVELPTAVVKDGCSFVCWCSDENLLNPVTRIISGETGDKKFYAKWVANTYDVTLNTNGGELSENLTKYVFGNEVRLPDCQKTGYMFDGWFDNENFIGQSVESISMTDFGNKTFYAKWTKLNYSISYNNNGGTINSEYVTSYSYGDEIVLPTKVSKNGCTFDGWYNNENLSGEAITHISASEYGNKKLYAKWSAMTYSVVFHLNDGEIKLGQFDSYVFGNSVTLPVNVEKEGQTFYGWYDNENLNGQPVSAINNTDFGDKEYWAKWGAKGYKIAFNTNNGVINEGNIVAYVFGTEQTLPTNVTKTGYTFLGWYDNANCEGTPIEKITNTDLGDKTFYAKWQVNVYHVTLQANEGFINSGNIQIYTFGIGSMLPTDVLRDGYTFAGWYEDEDFSDERVLRINEGEYGDKIYYAKWTANTYNLTFNVNEGTINSGNVSSYTFGKEVQLPTNVTKNGYLFAGWFTNSGYEGQAVEKITKTDLGNKQFWAKWNVNTYNLKFNTNGGEITAGNIETYTYGVGAILPTDVERKGYQFLGWYNNELCNGDKIVSVSTIDNEDKEYWAKWMVNSYKISYNINGGTINSIYQNNYTYGEEFDLPTDVTKEGYTFLGWYDNTNFIGDVKEKISSEQIGDVALYARWSTNVYTISFNTNEGDINSGNVSLYVYGTSTILPSDITRSGYVFAGWYEKSDFSSERAIRITETDLGNKTYYAKWTPNIYDVFFYNNGGLLVDTTFDSYIYGVEVKLPANVVRVGYQFDGWFGNSNFIGNQITKIASNELGDKSFYAKWTANEYAVRFNTNGGEFVGENVSEYVYGEGTTLPMSVTREGYTFAGWYNNVDLTGSPISRISISETGDKEFFAKWTENVYSVTLIANGGIINNGNVEKYTFGTTTPLPANLTRTGYTFAGWYRNSDLSGDAVSEIAKSDVGNKQFWAKWNAQSYAISYNENKGTINSGKVDVYIFGTNVLLPSDVAREGFTFAGWFDNENFEGERVYQIANTEYGNKQYFAKWTENSYSITYFVNSGIINSEYAKSYRYGEEIILPTTVTREGHTFAGWYTNDNFNGAVVESITTEDFGNKSFWAKWTINNYEVAADYNSEMGTVTGEGSFEYKSTATLKATANEGFEFVGWNNEITDNTIQFVVTKDSTVIANFKEKEKVAVAGSFEIPTLKTEREASAIDLTGLFTSTEGSEIIYSATSSQPNVVSATVSEGKLYLTVYEFEGEAEITVTGTLANGETNSVKATATVVLACNIQVADAIKNVSCYGESDGEIALQITNAAEPYTIQWTGETFTTDTITNLVANNYTINIEDAEGCAFQKTYTVTQPEEMTMKATIKNPTCSNADGAITIAVSGVEDALYQWNYEATTQNIENLVKGEYALTITNAETGCQISNNFTLTEPAAPIITVANVVATACNEANGAVTISASEDNLIYSWSNNTQTKNLTGVRAGDYTLNVVNQETNCTASLDVTVPSIALKQPEIALVTVSQETDNNLVVWLKENTDLIDFYTIYRQSEELGRYEEIAKVQYHELSVYEDTEVNPKETPWSYKISATDVCGTETAMSETHKTMQLIRTQDPFNKRQYDLNWTAYEGLEFSSYIVMRERKLNNRIVIDTLKVVPSDITTYSDTESEEGTIGYYVGIKLPNEINPKTQFLKAESGPFALAISNIAEAENEEETAVEDVEESTVLVYAAGHTIYVKNAEGKTISIHDNNGRCVSQMNDAETENEFTVRLDGIYFVTVGNESFKVMVR